MIFVDSNIPMYLVGADHPHEARARQLLERVIVEEERLVTDAEVFQEILHRYVAIDRREAIEPAFEVLLGIADAVLPIDLADVQRARRLLGDRGLSARDAIHVAVMQRHDVVRVMSFDRAFDAVPGLERVS
ncbi:MAG: type II toxin-antitoxin system VapC family toxin [Candidatus Limnocylindria bacterium]